MPKAKLTNPYIRALDPDEKQFIVWDTEKRGFGVMVNPKGTKTFVQDYTVNGKRRRMAVSRFGDQTVEQARKQADTITGMTAAGTDVLHEKRTAKAQRQGLTMAELCDEYMTAAEAGKVLKRRSKTPKKASTIATDKGRVERHIKPLLGKVPVSDLTPQQVQRFVDDVAAGKTAARVKSGKPRGVARVTGGAGTAARTVGLLGGILTWAVRQGYLAANPAVGVERAADQKRDRRLSAEEYRKLGMALEAAETEPWQAIAGVWLLALTGCRLGEIVNLQWTEIDLGAQVLVFDDTKTGKSVRPLGMAAQAHIGALQRAKGVPWVLKGVRDETRPYGALDTAIARITKSAGLAGVTAHVLRHSFASVAADLDYSDGTIGTLIGHKGNSITSRYTHRMDSVLIAAATKVANEIERMMTGRGAEVVALPRRA